MEEHARILFLIFKRCFDNVRDRSAARICDFTASDQTVASSSPQGLNGSKFGRLGDGRLPECRQKSSKKPKSELEVHDRSNPSIMPD